jgi:putative ABC transport system ATP-binding protein
MENDVDSVVKLEKVTKSYGVSSSIYALDEVDLEIRRGEFVAVMGPSGSGKSTLLNLLCGLDQQSSGKVIFNGTELNKLTDDQVTRLRREKIGMIFQTFNLLPTLNALENVALPLRLQGQRRRAADNRAGEMLKRVGLDKRISHRPDEMSGGERQRVAIARALIFNPTVLLADEPTGNLDSNTGLEVLKLLGELQREFNTTIILVTHDEQAAAHCERRITLKDGRIVKDERTGQLFQNAKTGQI